MLVDARREYGQQADAYDRRWARYIRLSIRPVLRHLEIRPGDRLLDVACGTGILLEQISRRWPETRLYGIDPSAAMLRQAGLRLGGRGSLIQGVAAPLPFAARSFAAVVSTSSLRYWADSRAGLEEISRVLQPNGQLLLLDWCGDAIRLRLLGHWLELTGRVAGHIHRSEELARLLSTFGFEAEVECVEAGWFWRLVFARARLPAP